VKALGLIGRYKDALDAADQLLHGYPFDFEVLAYRVDASNKQLHIDADRTSNVHTDNNYNCNNSNSVSTSDTSIVSEINATDADTISKVDRLYRYIESIGKVPVPAWSNDVHDDDET